MSNRNLILVTAAVMCLLVPTSLLLAAAKQQSLVPDTANTSPDYFCSWNIQGYASNYISGAQKDALRESALFGAGQYENWLGQYPKIARDLYFLMDEGWDMPDEQVMVLPSRFPSYVGSTQDASFKALSDAIKSHGWRGLGLWMRCDARNDDFWVERLNWMKASGVAYWKVDYGKNEKDKTFRHHLTDLGRQYDPDLTIETALIPDAITFGDTYRTYDVDGLLSIPETLSRVAGELKYKNVLPAKGLINCEDEVYLGAALGCTYGIMRHSFVGNLPNGHQDFVFPPLTRDIKSCNDEVVRAVRWHRIAPAFGVSATSTGISAESLTDSWYFEKDESWRIAPGTSVSVTAPAEVTRGIDLPTVTLCSGTIAPFVVASRNPNGAVSIATLGRTVCPSKSEREWITGSAADVTLHVGQNSGLIGIFGRYHSLTFVYDAPLGKAIFVAQDLAGDVPHDITSQVKVKANTVTLPGTIIERVGLADATPGDKSEPGLVFSIRHR